MSKISGHIVDLHRKEIYDGEIIIKDSHIVSIRRASNVDDQYILPGFIDAHVHVESSMLVPSEFARLAVVHGTVSTVSDPHEIANVLGVEGVEYMINNGKQVPFKFNFGVPSCVPATSFETAGAIIDVDDVRRLIARPEVKYLAEMMNWPGVLNRDAEVMAKIAATLNAGKVVDGHAPGLRGEQAEQYISAGISTDHECFTREEALDKLRLGMKVIVREGSAARNFDALIGLAHDHYENMMFCSDDKHPDSLEVGHINQLVVQAIERGVDIFKILQMACVNPVEHYKLDVGLLRENDPADLIIVKDLKSFSVIKTIINGDVVAENGRTLIPRTPVAVVNNFNASSKSVSDIGVRATGDSMNVIEVMDGQLITNKIVSKAKVVDGVVVSDVDNDILKIVVVNRYKDSAPAVGFVKNIGLKRGAIASCVAHDSHNIIAVGVDDDSICRAINLIIKSKGGVSAVESQHEHILPLTVAGIMSADDSYVVAENYKKIDAFAKSLGTTLSAPFMTLSFLALLVIPSLKLSDLGLFDGDRFAFTALFTREDAS